MKPFVGFLEPDARVCLSVEVVLLHQVTPACDSSHTCVTGQLPSALDDSCGLYFKSDVNTEQFVCNGCT